MKLIFNNKNELDVKVVEEGPEFYDNANRRVLTVQAAPDSAGLDALDALLANPDNLKTLKVTDEGTEEVDIFTNYCIKMELAKKTVPTGEGVDEYGNPATDERIQFKLGRYTPIELKLIQLGIM